MWQVWHCEEASLLPHVVVVDDEMRLWVEYVFPFKVVPGTNELEVKVCKAKEIQILVEQRLVLINPLDDEQMREEEGGQGMRFYSTSGRFEPVEVTFNPPGNEEELKERLRSLLASISGPALGFRIGLYL